MLSSVAGHQDTGEADGTRDGKIRASVPLHSSPALPWHDGVADVPRNMRRQASLPGRKRRSNRRRRFAIPQPETRNGMRGLRLPSGCRTVPFSSVRSRRKTAASRRSSAAARADIAHRVWRPAFLERRGVGRQHASFAPPGAIRRSIVSLSPIGGSGAASDAGILSNGLPITRLRDG